MFTDLGNSWIWNLGQPIIRVKYLTIWAEVDFESMMVNTENCGRKKKVIVCADFKVEFFFAAVVFYLLLSCPLILSKVQLWYVENYVFCLANLLQFFPLVYKNALRRYKWFLSLPCLMREFRVLFTEFLCPNLEKLHLSCLFSWPTLMEASQIAFCNVLHYILSYNIIFLINSVQLQNDPSMTSELEACILLAIGKQMFILKLFRILIDMSLFSINKLLPLMGMF